MKRKLPLCEDSVPMRALLERHASPLAQEVERCLPDIPRDLRQLILELSRFAGAMQHKFSLPPFPDEMHVHKGYLWVVGSALSVLRLADIDVGALPKYIALAESLESMLPVPERAELVCPSLGSVYSVDKRVSGRRRDLDDVWTHHVSAWVQPGKQALLGSLTTSGLYLLDVATGQARLVDEHLGGRIHCILRLASSDTSASESIAFMAVASDTVCIWKVEEQQTTLVAELCGHGDEVLSLLQLPDGRLVSGSIDRTLRIWDCSSWSCLAVLRGHTGSVHSLAYLASGELVSGSTDSTMRVWNLSSSECDCVLEKHKGHGRVKALAVLPDQRLVSADDDGNLFVWK